MGEEAVRVRKLGVVHLILDAGSRTRRRALGSRIWGIKGKETKHRA